MRYYFSVQQIHETHMQKWDLLVKKYVKMGLGVQKHGVSDADTFHQYMLCAKIPSKLYKKLILETLPQEEQQETDITSLFLYNIPSLLSENLAGPPCLHP